MKIIKKISLIFLLSIHTISHSGDFLKQFVKTDANQKFFVGVIEEKQKLLDEFEKEQIERIDANKTFVEKISRQIDEVKTLLTNAENGLQSNPDDDFLTKQQLLLKESEQILKDTQRTHEDNNSLLTELITLLRSFVEDPQFENFKKKK